MTEYLVIGIVVAILSASIYVVISQKRKGVRCIGCPQAGSCSPKNKDKTKITIDEIK